MKIRTNVYRRNSKQMGMEQDKERDNDNERKI